MFCLKGKKRFLTFCMNPCIQTLLLLLFCRLVAMYFIPLNDSTEARYGEIARKMLETGNWVTPLHDYGIPFWAKPPLSTWLSALSMKLFGVNEFAVRLPSLLLSLGILRLTWLLAKQRAGAQYAWNVILVMSLCIAFVVNAGAVMTDAALLFSVTLVMVAFWLTVMEDMPSWRYLFFVGVSLGLLAKGPIILVLTGLPIFVWMIIQKEWVRVWKKLPWFKGICLTAIIALPWYLLAEHQTPGFLQYFIVGEHLGRFLEPGWAGDKYGSAHQAPYGMIWIYALFGLLPWTCLVPVWWRSKRIQRSTTETAFSLSWSRFLICFTLTPCVFFSFARNIIYPYVLPSIPAFALYAANFIQQRNLSQQFRQDFVRIGRVYCPVILGMVALFLFCPTLVMRSQKPIVEAWQKKYPLQNGLLIYWDVKPHFSAQFYTQGRVAATLDPQILIKLWEKNADNGLVMRTNPGVPLPMIPSCLQEHLTQAGLISIHKEDYVLYADTIMKPQLSNRE